MSDTNHAMRVFTVYDKGRPSVVLGQGAVFPTGETVVKWGAQDAWGVALYPTLELLDGSRPDLYIVVNTVSDAGVMTWK